MSGVNPGAVPVQPFLSGATVPAAGFGQLRYFYPRFGKAWEAVRLEFSAPPWNSTGRQPFAWELVQAFAKQNYPVVRIAVARDVTVSRPRTPKPELDVLGADNPFIEIIRLQDDALLPDPDRTLQLHQLVRRPYRLFQGLDESQLDQGYLSVARQAMPGLRSFVVVATPAGVRLMHDTGTWSVTVSCPEDAPSAFAYQVVTSATDQARTDVYLVRTRNVIITSEQATDMHGATALWAQLNVHIATRDFSLVPRQGTDLTVSRIRFVPFADTRFRGGSGSLRDLAIAIFELIIGCIPIVGTLYDIGQFLYAAATGRDFWDRPVSDTDLLVLGAAAILPVAFRSGKALLRLRAAADSAPALKLALEAKSIDAVALHAEPELVEALGALSGKSKDEVLSLVESAAKGGPDALTSIARLAKIVEPEYAKAISKRRISRVFSDDAVSFRHPVLSEGYQAYVSRGGKLDAAGWARAQRAGSRYHDELVAAIGADYRDVIRIAQAAEQIPEVAADAIRAFDQLAGRVDSYRDVLKLRRRLGKKFGAWFEADHLLEKRFFLSPRVEGVLDPDDIFATLVPKNQAVARQLDGYSSYVHLEKTNLMKRLIPVGKEDLYTLQQWWDVHIYAYRATGADMKSVLPRLKEMFQDLAAATGESLRFSERVELDELLYPRWVPGR